jgi:hypothetical protein
LARLLAEVREGGLVLLERGVDLVEEPVDLLDDVR